MDYPKTKIYFDGSHFIGIPPENKYGRNEKATKIKLKMKPKKKLKSYTKTKLGQRKKRLKKLLSN